MAIGPPDFCRLRLQSRVTFLFSKRLAGSVLFSIFKMLMKKLFPPGLLLLPVFFKTGPGNPLHSMHPCTYKSLDKNF